MICLWNCSASAWDVAVQETPRFMKPEGSLPFWKASVVKHHEASIPPTSQFTLQISNLVLSSLTSTGLQNGPFPWHLQIKIKHAFFSFPSHATCFIHLVCIDGKNIRLIVQVTKLLIMKFPLCLGYFFLASKYWPHQFSRLRTQLYYSQMNIKQQKN
jgi:hypothetical protein